MEVECVVVCTPFKPTPLANYPPPPGRAQHQHSRFVLFLDKVPDLSKVILTLKVEAAQLV
jgi:hypothetical protein